MWIILLVNRFHNNTSLVGLCGSSIIMTLSPAMCVFVRLLDVVTEGGLSHTHLAPFDWTTGVASYVDGTNTVSRKHTLGTEYCFLDLLCVSV